MLGLSFASWPKNEVLHHNTRQAKIYFIPTQSSSKSISASTNL